ncbi:undecaprenyl-diphosphatase [Lederbergia citrea]|uniref:Undecaprenyl-diphosphatase n=1 Tax=Lederbergia citrea TaxID=2833581 RepID=A0A942Z655_9BACI|nr:undecaprenyl-diphosphatase [Lederbergia citrea]MBS4204520.1 undecaprenyl-diphosphatase [Lederbergia citrea]MBS4223636.1 undecaprenyl-diphosphatase [Lederbergia citrea]
MNLDYQLFEMINQFAGKNHLIDQMVILFSKYGPILIGMVFVWLWFTKSGNKDNNRQIVLFALTITVIALGLNKLIEMMYFRPRPFVDHAVNLLSEKTSLDPSFPSNHSAGSFALAFALFWKRRKIGGIFLVFAVLMALSRIFIGVHYPLDVTAGATIALLVTFMVIWQRHLLEPLFNLVIRIFSKSNSKSVNL